MIVVTDDQRKLLRPSQVAAALGVNPATVSRWVQSGTLVPAERTAGGHARFILDDVRRQLAEARERRSTD